MRRIRLEHGISSLEFGLILPVLMLVLTASVPILQAGWSYLTLSRATAAGVRYASRADTNARQFSDCDERSGLTRRPKRCEVEAFVRNAADPLALSSVHTMVGGDPSVDPADALPGETITVLATHEVRFFIPLVDVANGLFGRELLPQSRVISVSAQGREE